MDSIIVIFSLNGQLVYDNDLIRELVQIQLNLPNGLYVAVITSKNSTQTHKLIITE